MDVSLFNFELPNSAIAVSPASPRDSAKMLHITPEGMLDKQVRDLPLALRSGDLLVFNDTKVIPARLYGLRGEVKVELLLHKQNIESPLEWRSFARPAKRLKIGQQVVFGDDFSAEVIDKLPSGEVVVRFAEATLDGFYQKLTQYGEMPLPPYISRPDGATEEDSECYQTCYAEHEGSVAAPTAGLHFTDGLLAALDEQGVDHVFVTLHVGGGTFLPVKADDTTDHVMHSEWGEVSATVAARITEVKAAGGRVIPVGTTSLRLLESAAQKTGVVQPFCAETDIFITPGYEFLVADLLMTNFHLPKSTLFMLVSAFAGLDVMQKAYEHAIASDYRFYSYGDACLLERA